MSSTPWREIEIVLGASLSHARPYLEQEVNAIFRNEKGVELHRPAFWDGDKTWKIRFAAPTAGTWTYEVTSTPLDPALQQKGEVVITASTTQTGNRFFDDGFWKMSPKGRSLIHANGSPAVLVADTAWALPWRATPQEVLDYSKDRQSKGFNAALLMVVQPDKFAKGPRDRSADEGFAVGFEDLPTGHINEINIQYFREFDVLNSILVEHGIVPVLQPVFHGFGWKGLETAGPGLDPVEAARFARYLVARYGARPAIYLVGADGVGNEPSIEAAGIEVEKYDCYKQPAGIHYRPHTVANQHQDREWLDFQWCQTGHIGEHLPERVADMWRNLPPKAVANGEPTYENGGVKGRGSGWWQGLEAWGNLCAGGTMGVVYGAGSIWQWAHRGDEVGQSEFFLAEGCGWREALAFEGSTYVGLMNKIIGNLPLTDAEPSWSHVIGSRGLHVPGVIFVGFQEGGSEFRMMDDVIPPHYKVIDPRTGEIVLEGRRVGGIEAIPSTGAGPRVYICTND